MMLILNLTPHAINFDGGQAIAPSGVVARVDVQSVPHDGMTLSLGLPVATRQVGDITTFGDITPDVMTALQSAVCLGHDQDPDYLDLPVGVVVSAQLASCDLSPLFKWVQALAGVSTVTPYVFTVGQTTRHPDGSITTASLVLN